MPLLKDMGCYVNANNDHAFLFGAEEKITCISGYEAFTQALVSMPNQLEGGLGGVLFYCVLWQVIQGYPELPTEWKSDQSQARSFAIFYESHVKKGTYKMNAEGKV